MLELVLLGGVTLTREEQPLPWPQRGWQRAALLALLAAAGRRGMDRRELAEWLWPDSAPEAARHSLDQLLSRARRDLAAPDLFLGTARLNLNPAAVHCDLWAMDEALAGAHFERAARLYHGPFAAGLRVTASDEVERQVDALRRRFAQQWEGAVAALAAAAVREGRSDDAAIQWRRLLVHDPLNRSAALGAANALAARGRLAEAVTVLHAYRTLATEAHGAADPEVEALIARLVTGETPRDTVVLPPMSGPDDSRSGALLAGLLGRDYVVRERLREETLVVVHAARHTAGGNVEAQLLQPRIAAGVSPERFHAVWSQVRALVHPAILPTLETRASHDAFAVVTAVRPRQTLRDLLRRGPMPLDDVARTALQLIDALRHAHSRGVVHGDLRPKHVGMVGTSVVLFGFGFRGLLTDLPDEEKSTVVALGDPRYLSPEQMADNVRLDVASDIYAVGCILHEMLTGEPPFYSSRTPTLILQKVTGTAPRASVRRETVSPGLDTLVARCLARVPADRFASMEALQQALSDLDSGR